MNARKAEAALVWNTVVWGCTFVLVKAALDDISPLLFLALRFSLATVALVVLFAARRRLVWDWRTAAAGALAGVFLFAGYLAQTLGLRLTSAPKSAFITGLTSVMIPLVAALVYRSRPRVLEVVGILVATAGLGLLALRGGGVPLNPGDLLTLLGAVGFAAHIVVLGHFSERMGFELLSLAQVGSAAVLSRFAVLVGGDSPRRLAARRMGRHTGNRGAGHGAGVYDSGVGSTAHHRRPAPD